MSVIVYPFGRIEAIHPSLYLAVPKPAVSADRAILSSVYRTVCCCEGREIRFLMESFMNMMSLARRVPDGVHLAAFAWCSGP